MLAHGHGVAAIGRLEVLVEGGIVEARGGRIVAVRGEHHAVDARPERGAQAHRARLAARVEHAAAEVERAQPGGGLPDRRHLRVRRRVVRRGDAVRALEDPAVGRDDDRAERAAVGRGARAREVERARQVRVVTLRSVAVRVDGQRAVGTRVVGPDRRIRLGVLQGQRALLPCPRAACSRTTKPLLAERRTRLGRPSDAR